MQQMQQQMAGGGMAGQMAAMQNSMYGMMAQVSISFSSLLVPQSEMISSSTRLLPSSSSLPPPPLLLLARPQQQQYYSGYQYPGYGQQKPPAGEK